MSAVSATPSAAPKERDMLRIASFILLALALVITGYLAYTKLTNTSVVCVEASGFSCDSVSSSIYAYFPRGTGIPVAYLGFLTWVVIAAILLLENRVGFLQQYGSVLLLGIAAFGFLFHAYLTYTSIAFIGSLCPWCLASHAIMTVFLVIQGIRAYRMFVAR